MKARFIKVSLFERCSTRLHDSKVVGQGDDYLLLERPQPKPEVVKARKPRKPRVVKPVQAEVASA